MGDFNVGDKVIIKSTIGTTNTVCKIVEITHYLGYFGSKFAFYHLSNGDKTFLDCIELWRPKTDLDGGYTKNALRFIDSVSVYRQIKEHAYYLWLNGSNDTERNWSESEKHVLTQFKK